MEQGVKPFRPFSWAAGLVATVPRGLTVLAVLLSAASGPPALAAQPPDILVTRGGKEIPCRILRITDEKYVASVENKVRSFPATDIIGLRMGGRDRPAEFLIGSATTTFETVLGDNPVTLVAIAPLKIRDASPYPTWGTYYTEAGRYVAGRLDHSLPHTFRQVRIRFAFWSTQETYLGQQEYGYFNVKPAQPIHFAIDLTKPLARGQIKTVTVGIVSLQSRLFKQKGYQPH